MLPAASLHVPMQVLPSVRFFSFPPPFRLGLNPPGIGAWYVCLSQLALQPCEDRELHALHIDNIMDSHRMCLGSPTTRRPVDQSANDAAVQSHDEIPWIHPGGGRSTYLALCSKWILRVLTVSWAS